ncbi:hypothetical protein [Brucella thiophenivorans]|nr:hypothetical protein [Brucella thiophenivorans]
MYKLFGAIGTAFLFLATSPNVSFAAKDPFVGEYQGTCPGAQCYLEITKKKGKNYDVVFTARDRMNYKKILCKAVMKMERGRLEFNPSWNIEDGLSGPYKSDNLAYIEPGYGVMLLKNLEKCGKFEIGGEFNEYGD